VVAIHELPVQKLSNEKEAGINPASFF